MWKNILIVNDDGIEAEGLRRLAETAVRFGRVWVVAPLYQCSGMSQKISIFDKMTVTPYDYPVPVEAAWTVSGTPADCVKVAVNYLLKEKPDFVFSGINDGYNTGFDVAYSATVGAAMEALMKGIPAIAFSNALHGSYETIDAYLPLLMEDLMSAPLPPNEMWNVNFPGIPLEDCRGILTDCEVASVQMYLDLYHREELENGAFTLQNASSHISVDAAPEGSDIRAVLTGYISIGTLHCPVL